MTHRLQIMEQTRCTSCNRPIKPGQWARIPGWRQIPHDHDCTREDQR